MSAFKWSAIGTHGFTVLMAAVALASVGMPMVLGGPSSSAPVILLAVLLASWRGGVSAGLFVTALVAIATFQVRFSTPQLVRFALFALDSVAISLAVGASHGARRREQAATEGHRLSREQYRRIVETADEGIWLLDVEGRATFVNGRGAAMLGYAPEEVLGRPLLGFAEGVGGDRTGDTGGIDVEVAAARAMADLKLGRPARFDLRLRRCDGSTMWARLSASPILEGGAFGGALAMISDVTDRVAAAAALRRSEARFRRLSESGMIGVAMIDLAGRVLDANNEFLRVIGRDRDEVAGGRFRWLDLTPPEYREQDRRTMRELRTAGVSPPIVKEYLRKDGSRVAVLVGAARMEGPEEGDQGECVSFVLDVSARHRAEESLRLLAETGVVLAAPLRGGDSDAPLVGLARLAVPRLADLCLVDLVEPDGRLRRASSAFAPAWETDNGGEPKSSAGPVVASGASSLVGTVLRSGESLLVDEPGSRLAVSDELTRHGLTSLMVVPIWSRGRTIGAATFGFRSGHRKFDGEDLALAEELTRRAALAVDNARLYGEAREALRRRDEVHALIDALLEAAPVGVAFFDADLRYVRINRQLARLNGLPVESHLGRTFREVLPEKARTFEPVLRGVLDTGRPVLSMEISIPGTDTAEPTFWLTNFYPARGVSGTVIGVGVTLFEVTEARRVERELREAKEAAEAARARADVILSSITDGFFAVDHDWRFTYVNPRAEALLKRSAADLLGRSIWDELPEAEGSPFDLRQSEALATGDAIEFESYYAPLGVWFELHVYPSSDGLSVYFRDSSERRRSEEALRASERQFRTLSEAIPQMVWVAGSDGALEYLNGRWSEYTGLDPATLASAGWRQAVHPDDLARSASVWDESVARDEAVENLERIRRGSDGSFRWHLTRAVPVRGDDGRVVAWFGTATDIDDRRQAEEGLRLLAEASATLGQSLDYQSTLAAVARMAVPDLADWCIIDVVEPDGTLKRIAKAVGDPEKQRLSLPFGARYVPGSEFYSCPRRVADTGRSELVPDLLEAMRVRPPGEPDHSEVVRRLGLRSLICTPLLARGRVLGVISLVSSEVGRRYGPTDLALAEDLARRAAQAVDNARLFAEAHAARLEAESANAAKDRFLAALSHELRTPLTPVLVGVTAMLDDPDLPPGVRPVLEVTRRNVALEARLIDDLLDVTRIAQGKLRLSHAVVDAHGLIQQAVEICRDETAAAGLRLDLGLAATAPYILGDPARVQQILWNLVKNAVKFTPSGGRITVRSRNEPSDNGQAPSRLIVEVSDTGIGIDPAVLPRIFNAFEQGDASVTGRFGGLGLGLAICRSLAEAHRGRLSAASPGPGLGATFTLELPTVAAPPAAPTGGTGSPPAAGAADLANGASASSSPLRILLAEDNADTLRVMARLLRHRGHRVSTAEGVEAALRAADDDGPFDLVISDIGLPDGSGLDLIRQLRERQSLPAIALSGYGTDDDLRKSRDAGFLTHLTKPVDFPTLETAIRRTISGHPSTSAP